MAEYTCPLCHQPVPRSLYDRITGIWQERAKQLSQIKEERKKLRSQFRIEKQKLEQRLREVKSGRARYVKEAVERRTKALGREIERLRQQERRIEARAQLRIEAAERHAHSEAQKALKPKLAQLRRELRESAKVQLSKVRDRTRLRVEKKYQRMQYSFNAAIKTMKSQDDQMQKQQSRIKDLERQLARQTTPSVEGLLYETTLLRVLKRQFSEDIFTHPGKGGDIIQFVVSNKVSAGRILYECKRVQHYSGKHVNQTLLAKVKRKADFGILVTSAMKKGTQGFFAEKGVLIVHPAGVLTLTSVLRAQMVKISEMRLGQLERDKAVKQTLDYIQGAEFSNSIDGIIGETISLHEELMNEIKKHVVSWKKRYDSYARIHTEAHVVKQTTTAMLSGEPESAKLSTARFPSLVELPRTEEPYSG
jgi:hypothetical protein